MCSTCNFIKTKTQIYFKLIEKYINATAHSQYILHRDTLHSIKRTTFKSVCADFPLAKVTFNRMVMICILCFFTMLLDHCNIQRVYDRR